MTDWQEQYLAALEARDDVERANAEVYKAYTRLADRTPTLSKPVPSLPASASSPTTDTAATVPPSSIGRRTSKQPVPSTPLLDTPSLAQLRADFATTQAARTKLESELAAVQATHASLQISQKKDNKYIAQLTTQVTSLERRLRDRDSELRGKAKLLEDVQDENATLNMQLNVMEDEKGKLKGENRELVERWMKRMGEEAEKMNIEGRFS